MGCHRHQVMPILLQAKPHCRLRCLTHDFSCLLVLPATYTACLYRMQGPCRSVLLLLCLSYAPATVLLTALVAATGILYYQCGFSVWLISAAERLRVPTAPATGSSCDQPVSSKQMCRALPPSVIQAIVRFDCCICCFDCSPIDPALELGNTQIDCMRALAESRTFAQLGYQQPSRHGDIQTRCDRHSVLRTQPWGGGAEVQGSVTCTRQPCSLCRCTKS